MIKDNIYNNIVARFNTELQTSNTKTPCVVFDIDGTQPIVTCRSSDVTNVDTADTITIDSVTYNIVNVQPDGTGITTLILQD